MNRKMGWPQSRSGRSGEMRILPLPGFESELSSP
jgi:hypothetical protein